MKKSIALFLSAAFLVFFSGHAGAALLERGTGTITGISGDYKLIYDDVLDITWLDYTNAGNSWLNQKAWAQGLEVTFDGRTFTDWSLPAVDESTLNLDGLFGYEGPDTSGYHDYLWGYKMLSSEMGHLFYETLGNLGWYDENGTQRDTGYGLLNTDAFENLEAAFYWTETQSSEGTYFDWAWGFGFGVGVQMEGMQGGSALGLAIMPGDVSSVPIPGAIWMLGTGVACLLAARRKRPERE